MNYTNFRLRIPNQELADKIRGNAGSRNCLGYYEIGRLNEGVIYYIPTDKKSAYGYIEFLVSAAKKLSKESLRDRVADFLRERFYR